MKNLGVLLIALSLILGVAVAQGPGTQPAQNDSTMQVQQDRVPDANPTDRAESDWGWVGLLGLAGLLGLWRRDNVSRVDRDRTDVRDIRRAG